MLVAAAVCPHPPALVPQLAAGSAAELAVVRDAAVRAVERVLATGPDLLVVCGDAPGTGAVEVLVRADFRPLGVDLVLGDPSAVRLPASLAVARWLLGAAGWRSCEEPPPVTRTRWQGLGREITPTAAAAMGAAAARLAPRVAMVVVGDGSARRSASAPGGHHPDAGSFDAEVARALAAADPDGLVALSVARCDEQFAAGRAGWQFLAGATEGGCFAGTLDVHEAPYGVGYFVASWVRTPQPAARG